MRCSITYLVWLINLELSSGDVLLIERETSLEDRKCLSEARDVSFWISSSLSRIKSSLAQKNDEFRIIVVLGTPTSYVNVEKSESEDEGDTMWLV
jgi:hypothetical protein